METTTPKTTLISSALEGERLQVAVALNALDKLDCKNPAKSLRALSYMCWVSGCHPIIRQAAKLLATAYTLMRDPKAREAASIIREWYHVDVPEEQRLCRILWEFFWGEKNMIKASLHGLAYYSILITRPPIEELRPEMVPRVSWMMEHALLYYLSWRTGACRNVRSRSRDGGRESSVHVYLELVWERWEQFSILLLVTGMLEEALLPPLISLLAPGRVRPGDQLLYVNRTLETIQEGLRGGRVEQVNLASLLDTIAALTTLLVCYHKGLPPRRELKNTLIRAWTTLAQARWILLHRKQAGANGIN